MSRQTQQISKNDQSQQLIHEIRSKNEGESLYWRALPALARRLHGELVLPGDHAFTALWTTWNAAFAGYPAVIVRCLDAEDVIAAVTFARELGMAVSVRSGGHSIAGYGTNYNGMVIDLSPMKAIIIDPQQRSARIDPGLTCGEVAKALQPYGLALTSSDTASVATRISNQPCKQTAAQATVGRAGPGDPEPQEARGVNERAQRPGSEA